MIGRMIAYKMIDGGRKNSPSKMFGKMIDSLTSNPRDSSRLQSSFPKIQVNERNVSIIPLGVCGKRGPISLQFEF